MVSKRALPNSILNFAVNFIYSSSITKQLALYKIRCTLHTRFWRLFRLLWNSFDLNTIIHTAVNKIRYVELKTITRKYQYAFFIILGQSHDKEVFKFRGPSHNLHVHQRCIYQLMWWKRAYVMYFHLYIDFGIYTTLTDIGIPSFSRITVKFSGIPLSWI